MTDPTAPNWEELPEIEKQIVNSLTGIGEAMAGLTPDRVVLYYAYLTQQILGGLSEQVVNAREQNEYAKLDPRINVAGMVVAACLGEIRDAYEVMFNPDTLAEINLTTGAVLDSVDQMLNAIQVGDGDVEELLKDFNSKVDLMTAAAKGESVSLLSEEDLNAFLGEDPNEG